MYMHVCACVRVCWIMYERVIVSLVLVLHNSYHARFPETIYTRYESERPKLFAQIPRDEERKFREFKSRRVL